MARNFSSDILSGINSLKEKRDAGKSAFVCWRVISVFNMKSHNHPLSSSHIYRYDSILPVSTQIEAEQATHNKLESELALLNEKLSKSKANLKALQESKDEYTATIQETEQVYNKIIESSQNLLNVIKRDSKAIQKKINQKKVP